MKLDWNVINEKPIQKALIPNGGFPNMFRPVAGADALKDIYKARTPIYSPVDVAEIIRATPILRGIFNTIEREIFDVNIAIVPTFEKICRKCKVEYEEGDKTCSNKHCSDEGKELDVPDVAQKGKLANLMKHANPDDDSKTILKGMLRNDLGQANYYVSIGYRSARRFGGAMRKAGGVYLEEPTEIRVVGDDYGHIGDPNQLICMICNDGKVYGSNKGGYTDFIKATKLVPSKTDEFVKILRKTIGMFTKAGYQHLEGEFFLSPTAAGRGVDVYRMARAVAEAKNVLTLVCPSCGGKLLPTAYVKLKNRNSNEIETRFTKEDMIHGSSTRVPPSYYGVSNVIVGWKLLQSINAMDDLNRQTYTGKHLGAIINWPDMSQEEVNEIIRKSNELASSSLDFDRITNEYTTTKGLTQIHLGSKEKPIQYIPIIDDLSKLKSLEFYNKYGDIMGMIYGVPSAYMNWAQKGGGSRDPAMQQDILLSGIRERMDWLQDQWNIEILPLFNITDYGIKFGSYYTKEDFRHAQMEKLRADVVRLYGESGYEGYFNEGGSFVITGRIQIPSESNADEEKTDEEDDKNPKPKTTKSKRLPHSRDERLKISDSSDQITKG